MALMKDPKKKAQDLKKVTERMLDPTVQLKLRKQLLLHLMMDGSEESGAILNSFLEEAFRIK